MADSTSSNYSWIGSRNSPVQVGHPPGHHSPQHYAPLGGRPQQRQQRRGAPHPLLYTGPRGAEPFRPSTGPAQPSPDLTAVATVLPRATPRPSVTEDTSGLGLSAKWPTPLPPTPASAIEHSPRRATEDNVSPGTKVLPVLRTTKSVSDGMRGLRERLAWQYDHGAQHSPHDSSWEELPPPEAISEEIRTSFRSVVTTTSSQMDSYVSTERSSMATGYSSTSDFVKISAISPQLDRSASFSVEDAIGMYADGFETPSRRSIDAANLGRSPDRPTTSPREWSPRPINRHRRSMSVVLPQTTSPFIPPSESLAPPRPHGNVEYRASGEIFNAGLHKDSITVPQLPLPIPRALGAVPRDRYGFKKVSHHVTVQQFDAWEGPYNEHIRRRKAKWQAMMRQFGLATEDPQRFPPKSEKVKRYIRKGVPPEWRGAVWFWYAGGPNLQKKHEGLYFSLLERISQVGSDELKEVDQEHIERDLNRTFPDNIKFKPDPPIASTSDPPDKAIPTPNEDGTDGPETPIIGALRRVLQAFAVHRPSIGYCQSLNFIAGLLLLFLDSDEEKAFLLLNVITIDFLPGTHGVSLEGANIDIAVLMACLRELLPSVWAKLDDKPPAAASPSSPATALSSPLQLPTVSLATTPWFLTLFLTTLPVESALRVWDVLFLEGSKTLFRAALAIFKLCEERIRAVSDPMEVFQIVQTLPRGLLDANALMEGCFRKRGGGGGLSQDTVERRRDELRRKVRQGSSNAPGLGAGPKRSVTGAEGVADGGASADGWALGGAFRGRLRSKTKGAAG